MGVVDKIISSSTIFYNELKSDEHGRYRSWEYCYKVFHDARKNKNNDFDYLSLNLAFYLASWGMYRGSSFLLQKDYKIHIPVVEEILKTEYNSLFGINCSSYNNKENLDKLFNLSKFILKFYCEVRKTVKKSDIKQEVSEVLVTKILMGTLGCCPAYDRYFKAGLASSKIGIQQYGKNSIAKLVQFYEINNIALEDARVKMNVEGLPYPQMKILDMGFWQIGFNEDTKKSHLKSH